MMLNGGASYDRLIAGGVAVELAVQLDVEEHARHGGAMMHHYQVIDDVQTSSTGRRRDKQTN